MIFDKFIAKKNKTELDQGLSKTKAGLFDKISRSFIGKSKIDDEVLDELEDALIRSDIGVKTTIKIIERLQKKVSKNKYMNIKELYELLGIEIKDMLAQTTSNSAFILEETKPYIILVVGVNGVGKTTTIGKLAAQFKTEGKHVILGAADTFRAAAVEQLQLWGQRVGVEVITTNSKDPSSVAYTTVKEAIKQKSDVVIIDTAGRLHNKVNLMNELGKIKRVIQKNIPEAPHEILLVLDGSTGQNAVNQAEAFTKATQVNALAVTKLDGTAKGGVVIGITHEFNIPIKYIGVGEKIEDLQAFDKDTFVNALLNYEL